MRTHLWRLKFSILALCLILALPLFADQRKAVSIATAQVTDQSLIAAPGANFRIVIERYSIAVGATAAAVELKFGASDRVQHRMAVNSNIAVDGRWEAPANTALVLTTSSAGPTDVTVWYHVEPK